MRTIILEHPVHTLENRMLLPAGAALTDETLAALASLRAGSKYTELSMLSHGSIAEDILTFLSSSHYRSIFQSEERIKGLLEDMERVRLIPPILESLDYYRRHDFYSYRHFIMVFALSTLLAKDLVTEREGRVHLAATGPSHDIGKICVPLSILKKTTPLSRSEKKILDNHTGAGYVLLSYYLGDYTSLASSVARDHHERKDGSGQPRGVRLDNLMVEIIAVCDIYDALISPRPYRPESYDNRTALEELTRMAEGNKFGWDALKALIAHNRKSKPHYSESFVSREKRGVPPEHNSHGMIADD